MTNQIEYDRNKDRQRLFNKDFFEQSYKNNLMLLNVTFQCEKDYPTEPPTNVVDQLYPLLLTEYTAGFPIEEIKQRMEQIVYYCKQCLDIHRQYGQEENIMFI